MLADGIAEPESPARTAGGIPIRNIWYMLLYAWDQDMARGRWRAEIEAAPSLDALLASILTKLMQQHLRIGLGRDYVQETRLLRTLRGRIDFGRSLKGLTLQRNQAYCQFPELSANVPKNQIVRSTLNRVARIGEFGTDRAKAEQLRYRLRRLVRDLEGVDLIELNLDTLRRQNLGRNDSDSRLMLAICELLLRRQMPTESSGASFLPSVDRDSLTLYRVFERFVARFYAMHLENWEVRRQVWLGWDAGKTSEYLPSMQADLILKHRPSGKVVILDTKFTARVLGSTPHGRTVFRSEHIYQIYAYLRSQEQRSLAHRSATGILLYPTAKHDVAETVELQGHLLAFRTIDLALPWGEIERRLLALMHEQVQHES